MQRTPAPTRDRILVVARALFAERGYRGTSVGDVEKAAGLVPRRGALYKHFASKEELLRAVMAQHSEAVEAMDGRVAATDEPPLDQLELFCRWGLEELRREHELTRIVMKEGDRFPEIADAFREAIVAPGHQAATAWIEAQGVASGVPMPDAEALASILLDSLVGYTLQETLFGPEAGGVGDERFVAAWVQTSRAALEHPPDPRRQPDE